MNEQEGKFPEAFYRVSVKAMIHDDKNRVLVIKEDGSDWSLPGGGIDHGETVEAALVRELHEEIGVRAIRNMTYGDTKAFYYPYDDAWYMWIVYHVTLHGGAKIRKGTDTDALAYVFPHAFGMSTKITERMVHGVATKNLRR